MLRQPAKTEVVEEKSMLQKLGSILSFGPSKQAAKNSSSDEEMDEQLYMKRNLSAQECDSDDLEGDMNLSDDEGAVQSREVIKNQRKVERKQFNLKKANKYVIEVDTNITEITMDCLKTNAEIATGDAEFCSKCKAVFNYKSKLEKDIWQCEFCNNGNKVDLEEEERPQTEAVNYLLEASA
jgi:hypothetical protein